MLQSFEETKLYVSPNYTIERSLVGNSPSNQAEAETTEKVTDICNSVKLKRKQNVTQVTENPTVKNNVD